MMIKVALLAAAALLAHTAALAQATPVGLWKTIDDKTQQERSLVRITDSAGVLTGRIEKSLSGREPTAVCEKCTDDRKGKPLIGLDIVRNMKQDADDKAIWTGGDITDPDNGKIYRLRLTPMEGGKTLQVRGYIGPFYRNQTWLRVE